MGFVFSSIFNKLYTKQDKEVNMLILGLDNAGKTTILYKLHLNEVIQSSPTIGFNIETVTYKNLKFQVWDLGGQKTIRPYWRSYYPQTNAVIYVIDSTDTERLDQTKEELLQLFEEEELKGVPLMILANKQDIKGALSEEDVTERMGLTNIKNRQWALFKCSAMTGQGLNEGMEWIVSIINQDNQQNSSNN